MTWNCHGESSNNDIIGKWTLGNAIISNKYFLLFYPYPTLCKISNNCTASKKKTFFHLACKKGQFDGVEQGF